MLSIFGYDAQAPPTKNIDIEFQLGYESEPEMAKAKLGYEAHFSQYAPEGVIFSGGRSGSNAPAYIDSVSFTNNVDQRHVHSQHMPNNQRTTHSPSAP